MRVFLVTISFLLSVSYLWSQNGNTCQNPWQVSSLPFVLTNMTTEGSGNDYQLDAIACQSSFMSGEDFVFEFTPSTDMFIRVELDNALGTAIPIIGNAGNVGVFILDACPSDAQVGCIEFAESLTGNPSIGQAFLTGGTTCYIIVSTNDIFGQNPNTPFDIFISEVFPTDIGIASLIQPFSAYNLSSSEMVVVQIENFGSDTLFGLEVGCDVAGIEQIEILNDTLLPGQFSTFSFTNPYDLSGYGTYVIKSWASVTGDLNHINDTLISLVENIEPQPGELCSSAVDIVGLPYYETGFSTEFYTSEYGVGDACSSSFMSGNDFVFSYTPASDQFVSIELLEATGVFSLITQGDLGRVGLFVLDGCPDLPTASCIASNEAASGNPSLTGIPLIAAQTYYIIISTDDLFGQNSYTEFNIRVTETYQVDGGVSAVLSPTSGFGLTSTEQLTVTVSNFGLEAISDFPLAFTLQGSAPVTEIITDTILPGESIDITFAGTVDLSIPGTYNFIVYANVPGDLNNSNNTAYEQVFNFAIPTGADCLHAAAVNQLPYIQTGLSTDNNTNSYGSGDACGSQFMVGNDYVFEYTPTNDHAIYIGLSNAMGSFSLFTQDYLGMVGLFLIEGCPDDPSAVCIASNEAQVGDPVIDSAMVTAGTTYYIVVATSDLFGQNSTTDFDIDIHGIYNYDLAVTQLLSPASSGSFSAAETVSVVVRNYGILAANSLDVFYSVDGAIVVETIPGTLNPGEAVSFSFSQTADLSEPGRIFEIKSWVAYSGDSNHSNDTISASVFHTPGPGADCQNFYSISSLPFERTGLSTFGFVNDYNSSSACSSSYLNQNDFVFRYMPLQGTQINIYISNSSAEAGVFVVKGCPDSPSAQCIAYNEAEDGNARLDSVSLNPSTLYYVVVSSESTPAISFDIKIVETASGFYETERRLLKIFPQPAADYLNVSTPFESFSVEVTSITGKVLFSGNYNSKKCKLETAVLPTGVYFVKLTSGSEILTGKFIKQ